MGTVFQIPWAYIGEQPADWPSPGLDWLNELGFKTAAMALREDSVSIDDEGLAAEPKLAIVLGTEGTGLTARTIADCDYTVRIPMQHRESRCGGALCLGRNGPPEAGRRDGRADYFSKRFMMA